MFPTVCCLILGLCSLTLARDSTKVLMLDTRNEEGYKTKHGEDYEVTLAKDTNRSPHNHHHHHHHNYHQSHHCIVHHWVHSSLIQPFVDEYQSSIRLGVVFMAKN